MPETVERTEERSPSTGPLLVRISPTRIVLGRLHDVSRHGFCIAHDYAEFYLGQEVRARSPWADIPARVVWIDHHDDEIMTGFRTD